jgi:hypothetical protein
MSQAALDGISVQSQKVQEEIVKNEDEQPKASDIKESKNSEEVIDNPENNKNDNSINLEKDQDAIENEKKD